MNGIIPALNVRAIGGLTQILKLSNRRNAGRTLGDRGVCHVSIGRSPVSRGAPLQNLHSSLVVVLTSVRFMSIKSYLLSI